MPINAYAGILAHHYHPFTLLNSGKVWLAGTFSASKHAWSCLPNWTSFHCPCIEIILFLLNAQKSNGSSGSCHVTPHTPFKKKSRVKEPWMKIQNGLGGRRYLFTAIRLCLQQGESPEDLLEILYDIR